MGRYRPVRTARRGQRDDAPAGGLRWLDRGAVRTHVSRRRSAPGLLHRLALHCARRGPAAGAGRQRRPGRHRLDRHQHRNASPAAVLSRARGSAARSAQEAPVLHHRRHRPDLRRPAALEQHGHDRYRHDQCAGPERAALLGAGRGGRPARTRCGAEIGAVPDPRLAHRDDGSTHAGLGAAARRRDQRRRLPADPLFPT